MIKNNNKKNKTKTKKLILFENITKKFHKNIANKNISFTIEKGERIGIIGANGAGKTTLVEQIIGVSKPTSGHIQYNFEYDKSPQEKMGMQFQDSSYPEALSVRDIINFSLDIYKSSIDKNEINKLLEIFQMKNFLKKRVKSLSGGQQQKLNVLLAIAHKPKIIILDEISTGLDVAAKFEIFKYIIDYIKDPNITSILISHNMDEIENLCDRILVLSNGELINDIKIKEVLKIHHSLNEFISNSIRNERN